MAYSDFNLETAVERFGLTVLPRADLFAGLEPVPVPDLLRAVLDRWAPQALEVNTEKARSELIIAPILMEAAHLAGGSLAVYSGVTLDVDRDRGLFGRCDYLVGRKIGPFLPGYPWLAVVEAKNEDIPGNLGQCVAEMVAADLVNDRRGHPIRVVHGCVTTGAEWLFLRLEAGSVTFDLRERNLAEVGRILAYLTRLSPGDPSGPTRPAGPAPAPRSP